MASCKECLNYTNCKHDRNSPYSDFLGVVNVEFNCVHFKSNKIGERTRCPMRHRNGNCLPIGGFCTSVNDEICTALHKAFDNGYIAGRMAENHADYLLANGVTFQKWIPVTERLPENEKDVLICAKRQLNFSGVKKTIFIVSTAFHTDGKMNTEESAYTWETEYMEAEYDEDADAYIIPEGWWESVNYGECFSAVHDFVTHWMPLPEPPGEEKK